MDTMKFVRKQLRSTEAAYRRAMKSIDQGHLVGHTLDVISAATTRSDLNSALTELERSRHRARRSLLARGIEEGLSMSELGRRMGFSRQLASRYAQEMSDDDWRERLPDGHRS
jgi:hypothetical protein